MNRTSAERRHNDITKAIRKRDICRKAYNWEWYDNLHQYSKNKIHCSCPMCTSKTNTSEYCWSVSGRYGGKNWTLRDKKIIDSMNEMEEEYYDGEEYEISKTKTKCA